MTPPAQPEREEGVPVAWCVLGSHGRPLETCLTERTARAVLLRDYDGADGYRVVPLYSADVPALLSRLAAAEGALARVREYAVTAAATCREAADQRANDLSKPDNHRIIDMLREQRHAWVEKGKSYDALIAYIDTFDVARTALGAERGRG